MPWWMDPPISPCFRRGRRAPCWPAGLAAQTCWMVDPPSMRCMKPKTTSLWRWGPLSQSSMRSSLQALGWMAAQTCQHRWTLSGGESCALFSRRLSLHARGQSGKPCLMPEMRVSRLFSRWRRRRCIPTMPHAALSARAPPNHSPHRACPKRQRRQVQGWRAWGTARRLCWWSVACQRRKFRGLCRKRLCSSPLLRSCRRYFETGPG
mmetsp:Transcript_21191/g.53488  ORF Transcript_21191/g.53488 Transcript_21191/m.53488 type:complete len:207 (-) Transcript_21191:212-832(-)